MKTNGGHSRKRAGDDYSINTENYKVRGDGRLKGKSDRKGIQDVETEMTGISGE